MNMDLLKKGEKELRRARVPPRDEGLPPPLLLYEHCPAKRKISHGVF